MIDLDDFKPVNDIWGHRAGDTLLKEFARRLQSQLRAPDYLARFGGDEFIIVLEDCGGERATDHLSAIADRLHTVVEVPFNIMPGQFAMVDMSMGVALCPLHGDNPDALLRLADAALYQSKTHKRDRTRWWAIFTEPALADGPALAFDREPGAYGAEAANLLEPLQDKFQGFILEFVEEFYHNLHQRREPSAITAQLDTEGFARLKKTQGDYLAKMLSPSLSATEHSKIALQSGRTHALIGLSTTEIVLAMQDYINLLYRKVQGLTLRPEQRNKITKIIDARFKQELRLELEGMSQVDDARQSLLLNLELQAATWARGGVLMPSALQTLMDGLDGLAGACYGGSDAKNAIVVAVARGGTEAYFDDIREAGVRFSFDQANATVIQSSTVRAWLSGEITTIPNYAVDPGLVNILPIASKHGIRSAASVPVFDRDGNPAFVVSLFGRYPCQFESWPVQLWLRSLQQFFHRHFVGDSTGGMSAIFIAQSDRVHYRHLLHDGGLRMYMQPIIDLHTGKIVKVEALARLQDGTVVLAPDRFLSAYGKQDLASLFHIGLVQALHWLREWEEAGLMLDLTINLPPSVLTMPECPAWVQHGIEATGIAPHRLYLELLETDDNMDPSKRDENIEALAKIGVTLVMDDLGSGYSGLLRLQTLPFLAAKIDRVSVKHAVTTPKKSIPFLGALVRIVHGLGMRVVMEGLETLELIEMAAALGADWGQGYAISKPIPPEDVLKFSNEWVFPIDPDYPAQALGKHAQAFSRGSFSFDWKRAIDPINIGGATLRSVFAGREKCSTGKSFAGTINAI